MNFAIELQINVATQLQVTLIKGRAVFLPQSLPNFWLKRLRLKI